LGDNSYLTAYNHIMTNIRRYYIPNSIIFITTVTKDRIPLFKSTDNVELLQRTIDRVKEKHPFDMIAFSFLPDHFHLLLQLQEGNPNFSVIMMSIKGNFTANYKNQYGMTAPTSLWQRRFWDHIIRNEQDLKNHLDYVHWNPVKHGFVKRPEEWQFSSFMEWVGRGIYDLGWGENDTPNYIKSLNFE